MPYSNYLARLIGPPLSVIGAAMVIHPATYLSAAIDSLKSPALLYFAAAVALTAGVALVLAHNVWVADWRILVTLFGWISIVDSALWLLLTDTYVSMWAGVLTGKTAVHVGGAMVFALGAVLSYFGYLARETQQAIREKHNEQDHAQKGPVDP